MSSPRNKGLYTCASRSETNPDFLGKSMTEIAKAEGENILIFKRVKEYLRITDHQALSYTQEDPGRVVKYSENSDK